ncbi:MAG TPA: hypothetical protein VGM32_04130, partial [Rhodopila sp.]
DALPASDARIFLTIEGYDQTLSALVQDVKNYTAAQLRFGMRFANAVTIDEAGTATADISRISLLEPDIASP